MIRSQSRLLGWSCLAVLGLVESTRWMLEEGLPGARSTLMSQAIGCILAACFWGGWSFFRDRDQTEGPTNGTNTSLGVLGYTLVLTAPALAVLISGNRLGTVTATLSLALTSVVTTLATAVASEGGDTDLAGGLWPGLAAVAGLLLLLAQPSPSGWRPWLALILLPCLTGVGAILGVKYAGAKGIRGYKATWSVCIALVASECVFFTGGFLTVGPHEWSLVAACVDAITLLSSLLLLASLGATRWSAQFLVIPLLGLTEGLVLFRPRLDLRSWLGLLLLAGGSLRLLLGGGTETSIRRSLLFRETEIKS